jgi:CBS domain-containing protein
MVSVRTIDPSATLADAEAILRTAPAEALAVVRSNRFLGLLLAEDLAAAQPSAATTLTIGEARAMLSRLSVTQIMRGEVSTVAPGTPISETARLIRDNGGPLPVLTGDSLLGWSVRWSYYRLSIRDQATAWRGGTSLSCVRKQTPPDWKNAPRIADGEVEVPDPTTRPIARMRRRSGCSRSQLRAR